MGPVDCFFYPWHTKKWLQAKLKIYLKMLQLYLVAIPYLKALTVLSGGSRSCPDIMAINRLAHRCSRSFRPYSPFSWAVELCAVRVGCCDFLFLFYLGVLVAFLWCVLFVWHLRLIPDTWTCMKFMKKMLEVTPLFFTFHSVQNISRWHQQEVCSSLALKKVEVRKPLILSLAPSDFCFITSPEHSAMHPSGMRA